MGKHKDKQKKHKRDKKKKDKKHKRHRSSSGSSSSSKTSEWVEKEVCKSPPSSNETLTPPQPSRNRDDWMSLPTSFFTESNADKRKLREEQKRLDKEKEKYNPALSGRELNPYWKDGGDGLPKFKKPIQEDEEEDHKYRHHQRSKTSYNQRPRSESSWKKKPETRDLKHKPPESIASSSESPTTKIQESTEADEDKVLSDKELNMLASKLIKAEIMGDERLISELKEKLEKARMIRTQAPSREAVILTETNSQGYSRPMKPHSRPFEDKYGPRNPKKKQKMETHNKDGERVRYFADDDNQSLQDMFQNEKFSSTHDQNAEFAKLAGKVRKNDDLDDVFTDKIRLQKNDEKEDSKTRDRAINEHRKLADSMDNCRLCLQSDSMPKHLMVSMGQTVFLSLPPHEPMTDGHCWLSPVRHVSCSTLLDENEWTDFLDFRKSLVRMFATRNEDVIFFESAKNIHRHPHMRLECVPVDREEGGMAPIYFKKAIDECEAEWVQNKKLVSLKGRDVRRAVPKGLPYFFVSFGMEEGFAHVIEDEKDFPDNFAQEIIGGMLDLHHGKWKRPKLEKFEKQSERVLEFSKSWKEFDCTLHT